MTLREANFDAESDREAIVDLLDGYARDPMGGGEPLPPATRAHLVEELRRRPYCRVILGFVEETPAALAICFEAFSTFACAPILNIHDFMVAPAFRGRGLGKRMLAKVEEVARERGCCKLTLEVLEGNHLARRLYEQVGFIGYTLDSTLGHALFCEKKLLPIEPLD